MAALCPILRYVNRTQTVAIVVVLLGVLQVAWGVQHFGDPFASFTFHGLVMPVDWAVICIAVGAWVILAGAAWVSTWWKP
jgi:uncharacterized membrane protein HdeD (DUF308 family)